MATAEVVAQIDGSNYPRTKVIDSEFGQALVLDEEVHAGRKIFQFAGKILPEPNMHTVQLDEHKHILCVGGPEFTSHSCEPNAYFVFGGELGNIVELVALRTIGVGEGVSFDYNTTEWDMSVKFKCLCKSPKCYHVVAGYKHLDATRRAAIEGQISPFIRQKRKTEAQSSGSEVPVLEAVGLATPAAAATGATTVTPTSLEVKHAGHEEPCGTAVVESQYGKALVATEAIEAGRKIYRYFGTMQDTPNMHTVCLSEGKHILCKGGPEFTCHSCAPNATFKFTEGEEWLELWAIRAIAAGEQITFDYNTTEWDMSVKFKCLCGAPNCYGWIAGYSHITSEQRAAIKSYLSPYIASRAAEPVAPSAVFPTAAPATVVA